MTVDELKNELDKCYEDAIVTMRTENDERVELLSIDIYDDEVILNL